MIIVRHNILRSGLRLPKALNYQQSLFLHSTPIAKMPELPEVESARRQVDKYCLNHILQRVDFKEAGGHKRDGLIDEIVIDTTLGSGEELVGRKLVRTSRKGKHIIWELAPGSSGNERNLVFHFGMTGNLRIKGNDDYVEYRSTSIRSDASGKGENKGGKDLQASQELEADEKALQQNGAWPPPFTKALFYFSGDVVVAFTDPRRLGRLRARRHPFEEEPIIELAADPINEMPNIDKFEELVKKAGTREIKTVLLDQNSVVCGIGNYLADECLHQAGIHPCQRTNELHKEEIARLRTSISNVCKTACDCLAAKRDFPETWLFHGRWGTKKEKKEAAKLHITEIKVGGRTTLFDHTKQILHRGNKKDAGRVGDEQTKKRAKMESTTSDTNK
jgi:formamidopyrimidine-DNA glycosylase